MAYKKSTFALISVVRVEINWQNNPELMKKFGQFQTENNIYPAVRGGSSGPDSYCYYYTAEDAGKIKSWLLKQKVKKVKEV